MLLNRFVYQTARIREDNSFIFYWRGCQHAYPSCILAKLSQREDFMDFFIFFIASLNRDLANGTLSVLRVTLLTTQFWHIFIYCICIIHSQLWCIYFISMLHEISSVAKVVNESTQKGSSDDMSEGMFLLVSFVVTLTLFKDILMLALH